MKNRKAIQRNIQKKCFKHLKKKCFKNINPKIATKNQVFDVNMKFSKTFF